MTPLQFIMKFKHIRKIAVFKKVYFMWILVEEGMLLYYGVLLQVSSAFGFKEMRSFFDVRMCV